MRRNTGPIASCFAAFLAALAPLLWLAIPMGAAAQASHCTDLEVRNSLAAETVPRFEQCDIAFVRRAWKLFGGDTPLNETTASATVPADIVTNQAPSAGDPTAYLEAGMNVTVSTGPESAPPNVFPALKVEASEPAQEGGELVFTITRTLADKPLDVTYATVAGDGTRAEIDFLATEGKLSFEPNVESLTVLVRIPIRAGANGARSVILRISAIDARGVEPTQGLGQIFDAAEEPGAIFSVTAALAPDGLAAILTVTRSGALPPYSLEYRYDAPGTQIAMSVDPQPLNFAEGAKSASASIEFACASEVTFTVSDPAGVAQIVNVQPVVPAPSGIQPGCEPVEPDLWWENPWVVGLGLAGLLVLVGFLWWLLRKPPDSPEPVEDVGGLAPIAPATTCSFEHGEGSCSGGAGLPFAMPPFRLSISTDWGGGGVSGALPIAQQEQDDA